MEKAKPSKQRNFNHCQGVHYWIW